MRDGSLLGFRDFGERPSVRRVEKNRVVSETTASSRRVGDFSFDGSRRFVDDVAAIDAGERSHEARRARLAATLVQPAEDFSEALAVGRIGTEKARRPHARLAAKRVDHEPGIFRHGPQPAVRRVMARLQPCVLLEGGTRFLRFFDRRQVAKTQKLHGRRRHQRANFPQLPWICCGDEESSHAVAGSGGGGTWRRRDPPYLARMDPT